MVAVLTSTPDGLVDPNGTNAPTDETVTTDALSALHHDGWRVITSHSTVS